MNDHKKEIAVAASVLVVGACVVASGGVCLEAAVAISEAQSAVVATVAETGATYGTIAAGGHALLLASGGAAIASTIASTIAIPIGLGLSALGHCDLGDNLVRAGVQGTGGDPSPPQIPDKDPAAPDPLPPPPLGYRPPMYEGY